MPTVIRLANRRAHGTNVARPQTTLQDLARAISVDVRTSSGSQAKTVSLLLMTMTQ